LKPRRGCAIFGGEVLVNVSKSEFIKLKEEKKVVQFVDLVDSSDKSHQIESNMKSTTRQKRLQKQKSLGRITGTFTVIRYTLV
jgi:uncharacterized protein (UPF0179 family)